MGRKYDNQLLNENTKFSHVAFEKVPLLSFQSLNVSTFIILLFLHIFYPCIFYKGSGAKSKGTDLLAA